ncbi:LysR family transcriptional regulator [Streptomyces sp. NPDC059255]|uniref:LysR family transcriptional regulator n=1 Tax=Streptomyces sp. NPDC059255 TaxID=3346793 RepID=UPI003691B829
MDDLRYLLAVAHTGRLVAAASALGVDHTTVSRRIRALEKVLAARLLERGSDGWELTEMGRVVAEQARPIEQALENVVLAARGMRQDALVGNFRITAPDGFGALFAAPALTRLQQEHPGLTIELITATRQLNLHQSGFDLAIAVGAPVTRRLFSEVLAEYSLGLYASEDYLARYGRPQSTDELRDHTVIFYIDSLLQVGDLDLGLYLPGVTARFTSTSIFAQLQATAVGAGVGLLPRFMTVGVPGLVELDDLGVHITLPFTLAARRDGVSRPAVQAVRRALREEVRRRHDELVKPM